ncbi:reverse transcriptase domain-containing protein [Tanacetum coccineum]
MKFAHSHDDYLYCADHTVKLIKEQWVDTIYLDGKWVETNEECNPEETRAISFYPSHEREHLEYAFLEVLRNHKGEITSSVADIKGIDSSFCTHKILMEDEYKPIVQPQRRVNLNIKEVVPKKGRMNVVKNENDKIIPQRTVTGWRVWYFQIPVAFDDQEKTTFTYPYGIFAYKIMPSSCATPQPHSNPDWSLPFKIICDASDYAVGAVLRQRRDKHFQPIHYASKTINEAQENYTTMEKELLAIMFAFDKFQQYMVLSKTIVFTKHSALRYLFTKQDAKPRLIRWILLLQEFDIEIHDKRGAENLAADHLSRLENPELRKLTKAKFRDLFPEERLMSITDQSNEPCKLVHSCGACQRAGNISARNETPQRLFLGKLKSRWYDPFTVNRTLKSGAIKLCDKEGHEFIVNRKRVKPYQLDVEDFDKEDDINLDDQGGVT